VATSTARKPYKNRGIGSNAKDAGAGIDELRAACGMSPLGSKSGDVECLSCLKTFRSEDRTLIRTCPKCKAGLRRGASDRDALYPPSLTTPRFTVRGERQPVKATALQAKQVERRSTR
jgi:hypothetical protein